MLTHLRPAFVLLLLMTVLTGIIYPLAITGVAQTLFSSGANGSMITLDNKVIGSRLIGQAWSSDKYFWGRPSAAGDKGYNAQASSGSNLGPTSKPLMDRIQASLDQLHQSIPVKSLPADAVTASGSGLDPDISPEFAKLQVARIAKARNLPEAQVNALVEANTSWPVVGLFAERHVNVLLLNLALDGLNSSSNG
jgi:K+-transporting ATPase ATPase C chain